MRCLLSTCRFVIQPDYRTYRLYCMWIFSWNHVAWNNQYFLKKLFQSGGTAMFSLLAMAGDLGGSIGPGIVGRITQNAGNNIRIGMGFGLIFPVILLFMLFLLYRKKSTQPQISKHWWTIKSKFFKTSVRSIKPILDSKSRIGFLLWFLSFPCNFFYIG